ncbi:Nucleoporin nup85 [Coemansia erecta]|nr:Nucleoporin nup85 [Coemansia erecta]
MGKQPREHLKSDIRVYPQDQRVYVCKLTPIPDERLPFVNDTHAVFVAVQNILDANNNSEGVVGIDGLLRMSALYREAMLRQVRVLQDAVGSEFILSEVDTFQSMHAVWHLLELIFLTTNTGLSTSVVPSYMQWLNFNFPAPTPDDKLHQIITGPNADADKMAQNKGFWPYVKKLALRGHITTLAHVLDQVAPSQQLSAPASRWARELAQTAREMPLGSHEETAGSFNARWRRWNSGLESMATNIGSLLDKNEDTELSALSEIVDVMRGDADAISSAGDTWQDILGALLLYSEPTAQADRLPALAQIVLEQFQMSEFVLLDRTLVALLRHELPEFLVYCNQIDPWLSAHLGDLMDHIGILDVCRRVFAVEPREHYLIALGERYLTHENLWRVSMDYFGLCGTPRGLCVMDEYIVRMPLESDRKAQQVLRLCERFELTQAKERVHRQLARQKWQRGRLGAAIAHFAQVKDRGMVGQICDQLWHEYLGSGRLTYGPIIDGVLASGLKHDRLQFLTQYRDFHESYKDGDFAAAGKLLLSILLGEIAPPHAVPDLLVDSIPLLEGEELVFSSDETLELMRCAESIEHSAFSKCSDDEASSSVGRDELSIFNVACARNLARSFVLQ